MDKIKILLVDDSRTALMLQRMMLAETGFEVLTASNGRQGVEQARSSRPDLIVMDVIMPELNGFEAVRAIRASPGLAEVPIILVTTRSEAFNVNEGYAAGCSGYMTKPFNGAALLDKIFQHLAPEHGEAGEEAELRA